MPLLSTKDDTTKVVVVQVPMKSVVNHQITKIMEKSYIREGYNQLLQSRHQSEPELILYWKNTADGTATKADYSLLHCRFFHDFFQNFEYSPASAVS
jgi:hypothetical protein